VTFVTYLLSHRGTPLERLRETTELWMLCLKLREADQMSIEQLVGSCLFFIALVPSMLLLMNLFAVSDPVLLGGGGCGKTQPKVQ